MKTSSYSAPAAVERNPPSVFTKRDSILSIENCLGQSSAIKQNQGISSSRPHWNSNNDSFVNNNNRAHTVDSSSGKFHSSSQQQASLLPANRAIPKRKLMVMNMLQNQLEEQRRKKVTEQQQEYLQSSSSSSSSQNVNRMTINHNVISNSDEQQGMFQELKEFLNPYGLEEDHSPITNNFNASKMQFPYNPEITSHSNVSPLILQHNNLLFNIGETTPHLSTFRKTHHPKEYFVKITNLPNSISKDDIHHLILERCKIISENIQLRQEKNKVQKYALIDMKSKSEAQEVKENIEGLKMDKHELKVKIKVKKLIKNKTSACNEKNETCDNQNKDSNNKEQACISSECIMTNRKHAPPAIEKFFTSIPIDYKITESVEDILGYTYCNKSYLMIALTHGHPTMKEWVTESRKMISTFLEDPHFVIYVDNPTFNTLISHTHNEIEQSIIMSALMKLNMLDQYCNKFTSGYNVVSVSELADCFLSLMHSVKEDCEGDEEELKVVLWRMYQPLGCLVSANISEEDLAMLIQRESTLCQNTIPAMSSTNNKCSASNFSHLLHQNLVTAPNGDLNYEGMIFSEECLGKALHYASRASSKTTSSIKALIRRGADPNFRLQGFTPLMIAKTPSQIKTLIQYGAALDEVSEPHGLNVLRCAVERRNLSVVTYLLEEFAFVKIPDDQIRQATDHAIHLLSRDQLEEKKKTKLFEIIEVLQNTLESHME
ncbi:hypothetical protein FDP41_000905 [Naegleria fowleri]|uniref:RRM domain-containing protein n=1 Tax=Naegleria fowleri TaxID=5763 RepID=A0A6A5BYR7_NAEFO|nr:uncharacterized protein FDP41_000905 [Naegleria fowleri]KAF0979752.1 hypothetical protein FDP41_000905 [Naegleria fowleri]